MSARKRPKSMWREKLGFVEHAVENATKGSRMGNGKEMAALVSTGINPTGIFSEFGTIFKKPASAITEMKMPFENFRF